MIKTSYRDFKQFISRTQRGGKKTNPEYLNDALIKFYASVYADYSVTEPGINPYFYGAVTKNPCEEFTTMTASEVIACKEANKVLKKIPASLKFYKVRREHLRHMLALKKDSVYGILLKQYKSKRRNSMDVIDKIISMLMDEKIISEDIKFSAYLKIKAKISAIIDE